MTDMIFASKNGRNIPLEDKAFGASNRAKKMIAEQGKDKVINATIGSLLNDEGELVVLENVRFNKGEKKMSFTVLVRLISPFKKVIFQPAEHVPSLKKSENQNERGMQRSNPCIL